MLQFYEKTHCSLRVWQSRESIKGAKLILTASLLLGKFVNGSLGGNDPTTLEVTMLISYSEKRITVRVWIRQYRLWQIDKWLAPENTVEKLWFASIWHVNLLLIDIVRANNLKWRNKDKMSSLWVDASIRWECFWKCGISLWSFMPLQTQEKTSLLLLFF